MPRRPLMALLVILGVLVAWRPALAQEFQPPSSGWRPPAEAFPWGSALQGVRIAISPGHGWLVETGGFQRERWKWKLCGACEGVIEDLLNAEICQDHLVPLLRQAGAKVYLARELDRQVQEVVVDDGDTGYSEEGPWRQGTTAGLGYGGAYRTLHAPDGGSAQWTLQVPVEGDYWVQARWAAGFNRCPDARFRVFHAGGETDFEVDQRTDGSTWIYLGRFHFLAGSASVVVEAPAEGECYVIGDAVRIGGGMDGTAGLPRWHMAALHWLPFSGAIGIASQGDVTVRPAWANGMGADLFVSMHANAGGGETSSGTQTYRHNCGTSARWEPLDPALCDDPSGSAALQSVIQEQVVEDLRSEWDPEWHDGGDLVANFGELRVLDTIPGALVEAAFFDGVKASGGHLYPDNRSLHDPRFRHVLSRGVVRAIVTMMAPGKPFPPEPPTHLALRNAGAGSLRATWRDAADAKGYRVYVARDGRSFDSGTVVEETAFDVPAGLPGEAVFVRVTSLNAGGESSASEAVGARARTDDGPADVLVVNGYDRLDAWVREDANRHDYVVEHGRAIAVAADGGWAFDGAANEAVVDGDILPGEYRVVDWILGRESTEAETFSAAEQDRAAAFLEGGGCLLASGTEVAWDLGAAGAVADKAFLAVRLGAVFGDDDSATRVVAATGSGPFQGVPEFRFDDGTGSTYDAMFPDILEPAPGARAVLQYDTGTVAGVARDQGAGRSILLGFPLETVRDAGIRESLMGRMLAFCGDPTPAGSPAEEPGLPESADGEDASDLTVVPEVETDLSTSTDLPVPDVAAGDPGVTPVDLAGEEVATPDAGEDRTSVQDQASVPDRVSVPDPAEEISGEVAAPESSSASGGGCAAGAAAGGARGVVLVCLALLAFLRFRRRAARSASRRNSILA